jgi:hypothetical protein
MNSTANQIPTNLSSALQTPEGGTVGISPARLWIIYGVFAFILVGSFLDLVRDTEHWPWSCYPMYSEPEHGTTFDDVRLYGVLASDPTQEISLYTDERFLQPFDQSRMNEILRSTWAKPGFDKALWNCLNRYDALRKAGKQDGPELAGLRVYNCFWTLDPDGKTIEHPDKKVLLSEIMKSAPTGAKS